METIGFIGLGNMGGGMSLEHPAGRLSYGG